MSDPPVSPEEPPPARWADIPNSVKILIGALFATSLATRGQLVALGLLVFDVTGRELDLGLLGLAEFLPVLILSPFGGTIADRFDRRVVYAVGLVVEAVASIGFFLLARSDVTSIGPILAIVLVFGSARAFVAPASRALPIDIAPENVVERVVATRSVAFHTAGIIGPMIVGLLFGIDRAIPFLLVIAAYLVAMALLRQVPASGVRQLESGTGARQAISDAVAGLRFIRRSPVLFSVMSLDLFAVLFGGAVALLPAIGEKRLGVGEAAVGALYSAIAIGALLTSLVLSIKPIRRRVGLVMYGAVAVFGLATIVLGLTRSYAVAFLALLVLSGADAISVFIRATLVPLASPENMRGRILATENIFIGGSNELGALESGVTASLFGLAWAVVLGGVGTLGVVAIWLVAFPTLRRVDRFKEVRPVEADP